MDAVKNILSRVLGKIPQRGTIVTPSGDEIFPVAICNEIMGGPFIVNSMEELKQIPIARMIKGCKCTVNEYTVNSIKYPTMTYMLVNVPTNTNIERLSDLPNVNISEYWILDQFTQQEEGATQYQYSGNYKGAKPPFLSSIIIKEAYNAGYGSNEDFGNTELIIWEDIYSVSEHVWVRQRNSSEADWGIPVKINEGYENGSYNDVRFQWASKAIGKPARPQSTIDGLSNDNPEGWSDTPTIPVGIDYSTYILSNDLWKINAIKDVKGGLLSEWSDPVIVSTNPQLVRYGTIATNTEYFNDIYWRGYYTVGDTYKASRPTELDPWSVEAIANESGEYIDYVFKEFPNSYEPVLDDAPKTLLGYGTNGWQDGAFITQDGYTLYVSTSRKYSDNSFVTPWSIPVRFDGKSTTRCVVTPIDNTGTVFKYTKNQGVTIISPSSIKIEAVLYDANSKIDSNKITKTEWYKGTYGSGGVLITKGLSSPQNPQISGTKDTVLEIFPGNVDNEQTYTARVFIELEDYIDTISILDATDGIGYVLSIYAPDSFTYRGTSSKTFYANLFENGVDITNSTSVTYKWFLNNVEISTNKNVTISDAAFIGIANLKLSATLNGVTYERIEALTDVADGKSIERQYSSLETLSVNSNPTTHPSEWSTSSANAIWAIERLTGESWGIAFRIKGEKGTPNGAFQKTVFRTVLSGESVPNRPTKRAAGSGTLVPVGWTDEPDSSASAGATIYGSKATLIKNPSNENVEELPENWIITGLTNQEWSLPFKVTYFPPAGEGGAAGSDGEAGWTPKHGVYTDGERRVLQLLDYTNPNPFAPNKPSGSGMFVGSSGLVSTAAQAIDIRGAQGLQGLQGTNGIFNASDFWDGPAYRFKRTGDPNHEFAFRKTKGGIIYYTGRAAISGLNNNMWVTESLGTIPQKFKPFYIDLSYDQLGDDDRMWVSLNGNLHDIINFDKSLNGTQAYLFYDKGVGTELSLRVHYVSNYVGVWSGCYMGESAVML